MPDYGYMWSRDSTMSRTRNNLSQSGTALNKALVANFKFKAYAPRAFDFFRKKYKLGLPEFMVSRFVYRHFLFSTYFIVHVSFL